MITPEKRTQIEDELTRIEQEENVTVLWACESGSRAWGFESKDSDYDVRFIYLRQTQDYLRVSPLRDVIEKPISDDLDITGWDVPKALALFRKSNPPLLEWLQSPIVYRKNEAFHTALTALMPDYFSPIGCMYHYMSMARRDRKCFLDKPDATIKVKKYFYMLRPVLACMWIEAGYDVPPIEFGKLLDRHLPEGELRAEIIRLREKKKQGIEIDESPQIPIITRFLLEQMDRFTEISSESQFTKAWEPLNELFRKTLLGCNGTTFDA